jgi:cytoskeletal protein CcmA (bactofilin family)
MSGDEKMEAYEKKLRETTSIPTQQISGSGRVHIEGIGEVHIAGSGFISPEEIRISGSGSLPGGLKVQKIRGAGAVSIGGDIEAEDIDFSGEASVKGNIITRTLIASGSLIVHGQVRGELVKGAGSCRVEKGIDLKDALRASGSLTVLGDVKATNAVSLNGKFDIEGKITTTDFEAKLSRSESHVSEGVQAVNVDVKKKRAEGMVILGVPILRRLFRYEGRLHTTDITAKETVNIENVSCENVQGKNVTVGKGCVVNRRIRYSNSISVDPGAKTANPPEKIRE